MPETKSHAPGTFSWVDLATTDLDAAKAFYSELFGWKLEDSPIPGGAVYSMASIDGKQVCGLSQQNEMMKEQGAPPCWTSYVSVDSADDSAKKVESLGGAVIAPAFDVMDVGRMAVLQDPGGATFAVWQAKTHHGASLMHDPGALTWNELHTHDKEQAKAFYGELFEWTPREKGEDATAYLEWQPKKAEHPAGGCIELNARFGPDYQSLPSYWMAYFAVADVDESASRIKSLGGNVFVGPQNIPKVGRFAVAADPQGAMFAIILLPPD